MIRAGAVPSVNSSTRRTHWRARAAVAAVTVLTLGFSALAAMPVSAAEPPVAIDVLTINDFHGRIEADGSAAGAAVLAGAVNQFRDAGNTLFVSAGDNIGASTFTSFIQQDTPTVDALNAIGLDASALGNHEFDRGRADLDDRVIPAADFPYLSANVYDRGTGQPAFEQYVVTEVDGISVGFIGAVTDQLPSLVSPAGIATLEVRDVVTEVNRVAADLHDGDPANGEADVTILLVHEGATSPDLGDSTDDSAFGRIVADTDPSVAAIVSAHTHQLYNHAIPVAGNALPRPVIQAASYGEDLGHLSLAVDPESHELVSISGEILPTVGADGVALYPADPAVAAIVTAASEAAEPLGAVKIGETTNDVNRARQSDGTENRGGESTLGNFVADVQLSATNASGAEIALMNPGGLRADLTYASSGPGDPDGNVSYREAASVQPFANTLVTLDLTGAQLRQVLEEQWQPAGSSRPFLKLGVSKSLAYTYDPTAPAGEHISNLFFNGVGIAPTDIHRIVVNSFLASGGDNFLTLASGTNQTDSGLTDLQAMVDFFGATGVVNPDQSQRAIGVTLTPPVDGGYLPGQGLDIGLSSLLMSAGEVGSDTVDVKLNGVGDSYPIDPTIVDTTDEVGRAQAAFQIPADAPSGLQNLTVEVVGTRTLITIPIVINEAPVVATATTTTTTVQRHFVSHKRAVQLRVEVAAAEGSPPTGRIQIFDRGELIKSRLLTSQQDGIVTTGIIGLSRGLHKLTVHFVGGDDFRASESRIVFVLVY